MDDDRLVHETLRSAHEMGAIALNYVKAEKAHFGSSGRIQSVLVKDTFTGKEKLVRAKHVVGSVGPWTDILGEDFFHHVASQEHIGAHRFLRVNGFLFCCYGLFRRKQLYEPMYLLWLCV